MEERDNIRSLHQRVDTMAQRLDLIYAALLGNEVAQDGGLVTRIVELENYSRFLSERIERMERKNIRGELYVRWMWAVGGTIAYAILMAIINFFLKNNSH